MITMGCIPSRNSLVLLLLLSCRTMMRANVFAFMATTRTMTPQQRALTQQSLSFVKQQQQPLRPRTSRSLPGAATTTMTSLAAFYALSAVDAGNHLFSTIDATAASSSVAISQGVDAVTQALTLTPDQAETLAGPLFGASLFPYLAFLYFLSRPAVECPKGVTVGFATCLLFVFLTIPAAIAAKVLYNVSLADSDWLHGSAESLLTLTNLVTVVAFRQALQAKEEAVVQAKEEDDDGNEGVTANMPRSATAYAPMVALVVIGTVLAGLTAAIPALASDTAVHTPYLYGFLDLPQDPFDTLGPHAQPANALSVPCWIIHVSSLVEFLVAMGFCWRWADVTRQPTWKGLTWGLLPLHSSGITACTYHLFYNQISVLVPLQAFLTCVGNTTAAFAAWRIAHAAGWSLGSDDINEEKEEGTATTTTGQTSAATGPIQDETSSLVGFEDLGQALAGDNDYSFLTKLFVGSAVASYVIKYGEVWFDFPFDANVYAGLAVIVIPSLLNAYKWSQRSKDPTFEGWF